MSDSRRAAGLRPQFAAALVVISVAVGGLLGYAVRPNSIAAPEDAPPPQAAPAGSVELETPPPDSSVHEIVIPGAGTLAVRYARLDCLSESALNEVRSDPASITSLYDRCREELVDGLGEHFADLSEAELQYVFCTAVSYWTAPYGPGGGATIEDMLAAETLQCAAYGPLAWELYDRCSREDGSSCEANFVGWEGGSVFNHQQTFISRPDGSRSLLVDPTIGLVAKVGFDQVASGGAVDLNDIALFGDRTDLAYSRMRIVDALVHGKYQPSDLLYYFESVTRLREHHGTPLEWPTQGAVDWRARQPAGAE